MHISIRRLHATTQLDHQEESPKLSDGGQELQLSVFGNQVPHGAGTSTGDMCTQASQHAQSNLETLIFGHCVQESSTAHLTLRMFSDPRAGTEVASGHCSLSDHESVNRYHVPLDPNPFTGKCGRQCFPEMIACGCAAACQPLVDDENTEAQSHQSVSPKVAPLSPTEEAVERSASNDIMQTQLDPPCTDQEDQHDSIVEALHQALAGSRENTITHLGDATPERRFELQLHERPRTLESLQSTHIGQTAQPIEEVVHSHKDFTPPKSKKPAEDRLRWERCWAALERQGWRMEYGPRGDGKQVYYLPPGVQRGPGTRNRFDYFDSQKLVLQHISSNPQPEEKDRESSPQLICGTKRTSSEPIETCQVRKKLRRGSFCIPRPKGRPKGRPKSKLNKGPKNRPKQQLEAQLSYSADGMLSGSCVLRGWVVVCTGFDQPETSRLSKLATDCGAFFSDNLPVHLPPGGGLAVIAKQELTTMKFLTALAFGVPPVLPGWLEATARSAEMEQVQTHALALHSFFGTEGHSWACALQPKPHNVFRRRSPSVGIHVRGSESFKASWYNVLFAAGAAALPRLGPDCHYILVENPPLQVSQAEAHKITQLGILTVGLDWLKACLSSQCEQQDVGFVEVMVI